VNPDFVRKAMSSPHHRCHKGHVHSWLNLSRRQFVQTAAGLGAGTLLGLGTAKGAQKKSSEPMPVPIPGGEPKLGGDLHIFGPTPDNSLSPIDAEPATIGNFNGFVGLAYISGSVQRTDRVTGQTVTLPMIGSDMRFMTGVFKATDDRVYQGAFAFV